MCVFVRTGAPRNGCSFEDDLSLGAEGQYREKHSTNTNTGFYSLLSVSCHFLIMYFVANNERNTLTFCLILHLA